MNAPGLRVVHRIVFPAPGDLDVLPLYVETDMERGSRFIGGPDENINNAVGAPQDVVRFGGDRRAGNGDSGARRSAVVRAGCRVSFGTYFNAFPAGYWRRWSVLDQVLLRLRVDGDCTIIVYRSTARGHSHPVESVDLQGGGDIVRTLPLSHFVDGGWYWFDLVAGAQDVTLHEADWAARTERMTNGSLSIGITTYNRAEFCVQGLRALAEAPEVLDILDRVYVVDQGSEPVKEHPDFADASKALSDALVLIEQGNLGGSGGFSRAMDETVRAAVSDYVLLLDDDIVAEPESILRAVTFADLARSPTIVGGHMFSLYDRSVLHALGESVNRYDWWWGPAPQTRHGHDFGRSSLRHTPWLHRRVDVDYNGWWMCLIPTSVVRDVGLALPVFIKWDDAEYGLRAKAAGYTTVSLPGVAVWHVPWQDKNDALDWQAYHHLRNRLVTALLHSPYPRGGSLVTENVQYQLRHLLSMQYSTAWLRIMAIEDVLDGPEHLHRDLPTKLRQLLSVRAAFADSRAEADLDEFPEVRCRKPPRRGREASAPQNGLDLLAKAAWGAVHQLRPVHETDERSPQAVLASQDAQWWRLASLDGALVSVADGTGAAWYQRDPDQFRALAARSAAAYARLVRRWPQLRRQYRRAAAEVTSPRRWRETFASSSR